jgi:GNAT superfamily N-acetyltransferase
MLVWLHGDTVTDEVERFLEPSHGSVSSAHIAAAEYRSGRWTLYGWVKDDELLGCIGFELQPDVAFIRSLVVAEPYRRRGVGRILVEAALAHVERPWVEAETDSEGVGFYRRMGFTTTSLGVTARDIERFRCVRATFV